MINRKSLVPVLFFFAAVSVAVAAQAQTNVTLPDNSQTTTMTADVTEQAKVTVPANITFNVVDVTNATAAGAASVSANNIVLATDTKQLQISIQAAAAAFTPPVTGAVTWSASDLSWNAPTWTGSASPAAGTLSSTAFSNVATCDADVATCSTTGLVFTLAAKPTVTRAGNHILTVNWKFASIGT
jgi:hypothetical protein